MEHASGGEWTLHLSTEVDGRKDARDFTAASCADLAAAAAIVLAVAVDPSRDAAPQSESPSGAPPGLAPVPTDPREAAVAARPSPPRSRLRQFSVAGGAAASLGVLASPAFGVDLGVAWVPPRFRVALDGLWFPASEVGGSTPGTGGSFRLLAVAATGCWVPLDGRIRLGGCLGLQTGELQAQANGTAVKQAYPTTSPWVAPTAGGLLVGRVLPHVGLRVGLDLVVPLVRDQFYVGGVDTVHTLSPVAAQTSVGVEVQIP